MEMGQVDLLLEHDFDRKYYYWMLITSIFLGTLCFGAFIFGTFYSYSSNGILTGLIFGIVGLYFAYRGRLHYLSFKLGASYRFCPEDSTFNLNYQGKRTSIPVADIEKVVISGHAQSNSEFNDEASAKFSLKNGQSVELPSNFAKGSAVKHYRDLLEVMRANQRN